MCPDQLGAHLLGPTIFVGSWLLGGDKTVVATVLRHRSLPQESAGHTVENKGTPGPQVFNTRGGVSPPPAG